MTRKQGNVSEVLSYGKEGAYTRLLPFAAVILLLGLFIFLLDGPGKPLGAAYICIAAGGGLFAFTLWRRFKPGPHGLVLSPNGIKYRHTARHIFEIPWDEVQGVESADIQFFHGRLRSTERNVPVVLVTERFYRTHIHLESLLQRGPSWKYQFIPKGDLVQIGFFPSVYAQTAAHLRDAIERRWRTFSNNPNAKAPPSPRPPEPRVWISGKLKSALAIALPLAMIPTMYWWQWIAAWQRSDVPEGSRAFYAERLLHATGLPARISDGTMNVLRKPDVAQIVGTQCRKQIVPDPTSRGVLPGYEASWRCVADLRLTMGETAIGAFRLVVERTGQQYPPGDYRRQSALVARPVDTRDAADIVCALRRC